MEGWLLTPAVGLKPMKQTLKGLKNFYMVGQWVQPGGGLPAGLMTGRKAAMEVCKKEGIAFKVSRFR
jgi:phytoene dehydrogenase-like protein